MALFKYNGQQWLNTDLIETIDDYGYDIGVNMRSGRKCVVGYHLRDEFFAAVENSYREMRSRQRVDEIILRTNPI